MNKMKKKYIKPQTTLIVLEIQNPLLVNSVNNGKEITGSVVKGDFEFVSEAPGDNASSDDDDEACAKRVGGTAWSTWDEE